MSDVEKNTVNENIVDDCSVKESEIIESANGDESVEGYCIGEITALRNENELLLKELDEVKGNYYRASAEIDNFRKRMMKETEDKIKYSNQLFITDFIGVLDNMELAMSHIGVDSNVENISNGVSLIIKQFKDMFVKYGVKDIELKVGDKFDPSMHDALMLDNNVDFEDNSVTFILQKGYIYNDRVLRPAKVKVNKK